MSKTESVNVTLNKGTAIALIDQAGVGMATLKRAANAALVGVSLQRADVPTLTIRVRRVPRNSRKPLGQYVVRTGDGTARITMDVWIHAGMFTPARQFGGVMPYDMKLPRRLAERFGLYDGVWLFSELEYLVYILGHEARHLWQDRISSRPWARPEYDADRHALRVLMRFRSQHGQAVGIGRAYLERTQDQPAHLRRSA